MLEIRKKYLNEYSEQEFIELMENFFENKNNLNPKGFGRFIDDLQKHVVKVSQHPLGNELIFNTPDEIDCSPVGITDEIKRWRLAQGLSLFSDSK